jgi:hypothetical protein
VYLVCLQLKQFWKRYYKAFNLLFSLSSVKQFWKRYYTTCCLVCLQLKQFLKRYSDERRSQRADDRFRHPDHSVDQHRRLWKSTSKMDGRGFNFFQRIIFPPCLSLMKLKKYNNGKWSKLLKNVFILYFMRAAHK